MEIRHTPLLIVHIIHRLHIGGLENGLVNLINNMDEEKFRHVVICMTEYTDFRYRFNREVPCYALHKKEGQDFAVFLRLWRLLREIQPDIVHTRNIGTLECVVPAVLSGVGVRLHGEHGRDINDLHGENRKHNYLRKFVSPWIYSFIALSKDLESWLKHAVGITPEKVIQIYNGVDTKKFRPQLTDMRIKSLADFDNRDSVIIGTVGRMRREKDPLNLVNAFIRLADSMPEYKDKLCLHMLGDGELYNEVKQTLDDAGYLDNAWLPGARNDVSELMQNMDMFVLPSKGEGISNTILEAMACGLPVIATNVGGNPELVVDGETGCLVPSCDSAALADAIAMYMQTPELLSKHGAAGRDRVLSNFSMKNMVDSYTNLYEAALT